MNGAVLEFVEAGANRRGRCDNRMICYETRAGYCRKEDLFDWRKVRVGKSFMATLRDLCAFMESVIGKC